MSLVNVLLMAVFLPLFPLSMLFNGLFARVGNTWLRIALMIGWPAAGIGLLSVFGNTPPPWVVHWSVATAILYGFRALALRDLALWLGHLATSSWALMWLPAASGSAASSLLLTLTTFSAPLALLVWLTGHLEKNFGAAYAGSLGGLATSLPRLSAFLVLLVLAAIGTPLFPSFFALLGMVNTVLPTMPATALGMMAVWMLWAWAGIRILQGLLVGPPGRAPHTDIDLASTGVLGIMVAMFTAGGIWISGSLI